MLMGIILKCISCTCEGIYVFLIRVTTSSVGSVHFCALNFAVSCIIQVSCMKGHHLPLRLSHPALIVGGRVDIANIHLARLAVVLDLESST